MMCIRAMFASASLLLAATVAFAQTVSHDVRKGANFSKFKTYAWTAGENLIDPLNHTRIVKAIDAQLAGKGLILVGAGASPDLLVAYDASFDTSLPNPTLSAAPNLRSGTGDESHIGTLVIRLVDARSKQTVWRGKITNVIDSYATAEKRETRITQAVAKLFQEFPPRT